MIEEYLKRIDQIEDLARQSSFARLMHAPKRQLLAYVHRNLIYPNRQLGIIREVNTFFDLPMNVRLPAGSDIYVLGSKTLNFELRLVRFLLNHLKKDQVFIDVGAHFGFFSLLASRLVGDAGKVFSFEPSDTTFEILSMNATNMLNINLNKNAVGEENGSLTFHEFPIIYSEYNTLDPEAYQRASWFDEEIVKKVEVPVVSIDYFTNEKNLIPDVIKVDVEGTEAKVIKGMLGLLRERDLLVILEYVPNAGNIEFHQALNMLAEHEYHPYLISGNGQLERLPDISELHQSEYLVFKKKATQ